MGGLESDTLHENFTNNNSEQSEFSVALLSSLTVSGLSAEKTITYGINSIFNPFYTLFLKCPAKWSTAVMSENKSQWKMCIVHIETDQYIL